MDLGQNEHMTLSRRQTVFIYNKCRRGIHVNQTLWNLTIFLNNISNIYIFNIINIFNDLSNVPDYYKY